MLLIRYFILLISFKLHPPCSSKFWSSDNNPCTTFKTFSSESKSYYMANLWGIWDQIRHLSHFPSHLDRRTIYGRQNCEAGGQSFNFWPQLISLKLEIILVESLKLESIILLLLSFTTVRQDNGLVHEIKLCMSNCRLAYFSTRSYRNLNHFQTSQFNVCTNRNPF